MNWVVLITVWPIGCSKWPTMKNGSPGPLGQSNMDPHMCDLRPWISVFLHFLCDTKLFAQSQICTLLVTNLATVCQVQICDSRVCHEFSGVSGPELLYGWTIYSPYTTLFWWRLPFAEKPNLHPYACFIAIRAFKMACNEKRWSGTTRISKYGPHICDLRPWIDTLLHFLYDTNIFTKSQIGTLLVTNLSKDNTFHCTCVIWTITNRYRITNQAALDKFVTKSVPICDFVGPTNLAIWAGLMQMWQIPALHDVHLHWCIRALAVEQHWTHEILHHIL